MFTIHFSIFEDFLRKILHVVLFWYILRLEAFKLFDQDKDGLITTEELKELIEKVGGCMSEGEARGMIRQVGTWIIVQIIRDWKSFVYLDTLFLVSHL